MAIDAVTWGLCQQALASLLKFAERDKFADERDMVGAAHLAAAYAAVGDDGGYEELVELVDEEVVAAVSDDALVDFAVRPGAGGLTLIDRYLAERSARETPVGRDFLRGLKSSRVGVFEVVGEMPDGGLELRDVLTEGPTVVVDDDPDLDPFAEGEFVGARLVPFREGHCFAGGVWVLEPDTVEAIQAAWSGVDAEALVADPDFSDLTAEELLAGVHENLPALISSMVLEQELRGDLSDDEEEDDDDEGDDDDDDEADAPAKPN